MQHQSNENEAGQAIRSKNCASEWHSGTNVLARLEHLLMNRCFGIYYVTKLHNIFKHSNILLALLI